MRKGSHKQVSQQKYLFRKMKGENCINLIERENHNSDFHTHNPKHIQPVINLVGI